MARTVTVERDLGFKKIRRELKKADGAVVRVGLFNDVRHPDSPGLSAASIGTIHEFGAPAAGIPARSFLRSTVDEKRQPHRRLLERLRGDFLDGRRTAENALLTFGELVASDVKKKITDLRSPKLEDATIAAKGSSNPLIDTGFMRASVEARIEI